MKIAVLSGKGGAGKTMVSVNLAAAAGKAVYLDCDVEEPNGRLFLKPDGVESRPVYTLLPSFDTEKCTGCRKCVNFCHFNALIYIRNKIKLFTEICHSCGGCALVCPEKAVTEEKKNVGFVETGFHGSIQAVTGLLNMGEASGIPVIEKVLHTPKADENCIIIDCPPGSACSVMESVKDADVCLLVAEPTAFGFHNFCMVHELCQLLHKPCAVIINKMDDPYEPLERYCQEQKLPILARIPYTDKNAERISKGQILCEQDEEMKLLFQNILSQARRLAP